MEENKIDFTDEEIKKALEDLDELTSSSPEKEEIKKSAAGEEKALDNQIAELQKQKEDLKKSNSTELEKNNINNEEIAKTVIDEISSKIDPVIVLIKAFDQTATLLKEENTKLVEQVSKLEKSIEDEIQKSESREEKIEKALNSIEEMADTPFGKLKSFKKAVQIDKFSRQDEDGKITKSLTENRHEINAMLNKAIDVSDNPEEKSIQLEETVGMIQGGYVGPHNFDMIKKTVENTLGEKYNIIG